MNGSPGGGREGRVSVSWRLLTLFVPQPVAAIAAEGCTYGRGS